MKRGLTERQSEILRYISDFIAEHRFSPSYRDIQQHFSYSSLGSVYKHLQVLKRKGSIDFEKNKNRSVIPVDPYCQSPISIASIPLAGRVMAEHPIELFPSPKNIEVPASMVPHIENNYALQVVGRGFTEELIDDGDLLIVEARLSAHDGETAVIQINHNETLIKKIFQEESYVRFEGRSGYQQPIILRNGDFTIMGVVVGLIRRLSA